MLICRYCEKPLTIEEEEEYEGQCASCYYEAYDPWNVPWKDEGYEYEYDDEDDDWFDDPKYN